jgi:hypothetical protein
MKCFYYFIFFLFGTFIISGCTASVNQYGISAENVESLRNMQSVSKVNISPFTSEAIHESINCRGSITIKTPNQNSFEEYIHNALISELKLAGLYDSNASLTINGHFEKLDSSSVVGDGKWMFVMRISADGKESFTVDSEYPFSCSWLGDRACQQVPQAFSPAVQKFIKDILNHPGFAAMIR